MLLDDIRDRLKGDIAQFWDKIQESSLYVSLKDRYDTLSPTRQKIVSAVTIAIILIVVFMVPLGTFWSSSDLVTEYEAKRDLIRELLRANKEANENSPDFAQPSTADVENQVKQALNQLNLLPEQIRSVMTVTNTGTLVKSSIVDGIVEVSTAQLNIRQVVTLGTSIARIQGTKLKDLIMNANQKDPRYFDALYRIVVFKTEGGGSGAAPGGAAPSGNGIPPPPPPPPGGRNLRGGK